MIVHILGKFRLKFPRVISPQILTFNVYMFMPENISIRNKPVIFKENCASSGCTEKSFFIFKVLRPTKYKSPEQEILQEEYE